MDPSRPRRRGSLFEDFALRKRVRTSDRRGNRQAVKRETVLIIEDEEDILEVMTYNLVKNGYRVLAASDGEEGLKRAKTEVPDALLLDLMLPGVGGLDVCRALKQDPRTQTIPILMVTARAEEADIVVGLELGADDYITKPFSPRVLVARLRAVLRRHSQPPESPGATVRVHDLVIHPGRREVTLGGRPIPLTFTEFSLLHLLARKPGWVFTRGQIVDAIRGEDYPVTDRSVDVHVTGLRRKLGAGAQWIETVRGVGYRLKE